VVSAGTFVAIIGAVGDAEKVSIGLGEARTVLPFPTGAITGIAGAGLNIVGAPLTSGVGLGITSEGTDGEGIAFTSFTRGSGSFMSGAGSVGNFDVVTRGSGVGIEGIPLGLGSDGMVVEPMPVGAGKAGIGKGPPAGRTPPLVRSMFGGGRSTLAVRMPVLGAGGFSGRIGVGSG